MLEPHQFNLLGGETVKHLKQSTRILARSGTFTDNMQLPIHRWFRYSAGFSAEWARGVVRSKTLDDGTLPVVLDPFAGTGTSVVAAATLGADAIGIEHHPFVGRLGRAKLLRSVDPKALLAAAARLIAAAAQVRARVDLTQAPELLRRCYSPESLLSLESLREAWCSGTEDNETRELLWFAITAILRSCSAVGTAQWQYVLPNKSKSRSAEPLRAFLGKVQDIASDLHEVWQKDRTTRIGQAEIRDADARDSGAYSGIAYDLVLTSPPYPNNYDYADATRIEMTYWREIDGWGDLQATVRNKLVRSCSQHTAAERLQLGALLEEPLLLPIRDELTAVCNELATVRLERGGRKTYHTMVAAYFLDLANVLRNLAGCRKTGAEVCMVIGDSAPYGVYVPVERWLSTLAVDFGFESCRFDKLRDRNIKWKNRKHRVPLKEGLLWIS